MKADWDAWNVRSLADEPIVRFILDGMVVEVRLDRKATANSLLVVIACARTARRCCRNALLGVACFRSDQHEKGRRLAHACQNIHRSAN